MTIQNIIDLHNYICDKEQKGLTLTPANVNTLLPSVQWELINDEMTNLVKDELTPISGELVAMSPLNPFKKSVDLNPVGGVAVAPDDYVRFLSFTTFGYNDPVAQVTVAKGYRDVTPVSNKQFSVQQGNVYARLDIHPILKITSLAGKFLFSILPNDVPLLKLDYLRTPVTPYYDYVWDSMGNPIYLAPGNTIETANFALSLFDVYADEYSNANGDDPLYSGVYYSLPAGVGVNYRSRTIELEWEARVYPTFVLHLLSKSGLNLSEEKITQYSELKLKENA